MTLRQATALGIRLLGLFILARVVISLPQIVLYAIYLSGPGAMEAAMEYGGGLSGAVFTYAGSILAGTVLVIWAKPISGWVFTDADPERKTPGIDGGRFFTYGIALVGLALAALSVPDLFGALIELRARDNPGAGSAYLAPVFALIVKIVIGIVLVRQAPAIARSVGGFWGEGDVDESTFD